MGRTLVASFSLAISMSLVVSRANTQNFTSDSNKVTVKVTNAGKGPQLQVLRISATSGFIQTPGWGNGTPHPENMNSVVLVEVPENHAAIVTVLHLNLTGNKFKCDSKMVKLDMYEDRLTRANIKWHCSMKQIAQRLRLATGADLYVHFKCWEIPDNAKDGFRFFFSVTEVSATLQAEQNNDLWNCSVPNFADFKPHFPCDLTPQCLDKEDERDCPYFSEECGLGFVDLGEYCLVYVKPRGLSTWRDNEFLCQQRGMRMASFRRREDYDRLVQYLEPMAAYWGFWMIAVGIRTPSASLPVMYRSELQNSDGTIAFSKWTESVNGLHLVCGSIVHYQDIRRYRKFIKLSYCTKKIAAINVLCEIRKGEPATDSLPKTFQLQAVSHYTNGSHPPLLVCPHEHVTRDFLACDVAASCWSRDMNSCPASHLTPLPPSFACANGFESVPYTLVCDVRPDCSDGSDESFCEFPPCGLPEPFYCNVDTRYQPPSARERASSKEGFKFSELLPFDLGPGDERPSAVCDGQRNCYNAEDEDLCSGKETKFVERRPPPAVIQLGRQGQFYVDNMTESPPEGLSPAAVCPETHFQCPGNGYYMPVFLRCNGVYDCAGKEDEGGCDTYTCPGFYRCRGSQVCLHPQHLCDDIFQCPQNDDELLCDLSCPHNCTCYGLAFYCRQPFRTRHFNKLRFLDGHGSGINVSDLSENFMLIYLSLAENGLTTIGELNFTNLRVLDLSDNQLKKIHLQHLQGLPQLEVLSLSGNPLLSSFQCDDTLKSSRRTSAVGNVVELMITVSHKVAAVTDHPLQIHKIMNVTHLPHSTTSNHIRFASCFDNIEVNATMPSLRTLDISRVKFKVLNPSFLSLLPNLHTVNMSGCGVDTLLGEGFQALTQLRALDLRGCPLTYFPRHVFRGLQELQTVHSDNYKLCCPATLPAGFVLKNCHAPSDEISSCEALLRSPSYRVFLSAFASLALLGNISSFVYRVFLQKRKRFLGFDIFVAHLCLTDFLMGVYLGVIGVADRLYQGTYLWEDNTWKASTVCHMAGFLSLVSSEVSALVICLITVDRFLVIRFPFSALHFGVHSAQVASLCVWGMGCVIAAVPLIPGVAHWRFYSQTGVCIPLPVSRADFPGYTYAFGVMIVTNFIFFVFIASGQTFIYCSVHTNSMSTGETTTKKTQDLTIARRLITVAMSDFLCWFPIGLTGMLAATGTPVSGEVNVAMAIFVLPFNSALNPFLYTLNVVLEKKRKADEERIRKRLMAQLRSVGTEDKIIPSRDSCIR